MSITPIYNAAINGHLDACRLLLESGANVNSLSAIKAIQWAINLGYIDICRLLLDYGMDPNINALRKNYLYGLPILNAIECHRIEIVKLLIYRGANINQIKPWRSPLEYARSNEAHDIFRLLTTYGAVE